MKKTLLLAVAALFFITNALAQTDVLNGVWVLDEGVQDWNTGEMITNASVSVYYPETDEYFLVYAFPGANFTTNIIIEEGYAYIGADDRITKINVETWEVAAEILVQGVRHLAYHDEMLYMTR